MRLSIAYAMVLVIDICDAIRRHWTKSYLIEVIAWRFINDEAAGKMFNEYSSESYTATPEVAEPNYV